MRQLQKAATVAAFLISVGMLIHAGNAFYFEPQTLGFEDPSKDYADMAKIANAQWSYSFTSSGISHIVVGFSLIILGLFFSELFRPALPIAARLVSISSLLAGLGFLLTGISDIPGTVYTGLLRDMNQPHNTEILLSQTIFRGMVNILAITCLGWFAGMISWCARQTDTFSKALRIFGWVVVLPGLLGLANPVFGFAYISLVLIWMPWLGLSIRKLEVGS